MAAFNKTVGTSVLALQNVAASSVLISPALDVATKLGALLGIHFGRTVATAAGAGVNIRIEGSVIDSVDGEWFTLQQFSTQFAACSDEAVNGACASGQAVIPMASTTGFTIGDLVYIKNTTIANGEFGRQKAVSSNTSITIEDNLVNTQTGSTVYDTAEFFQAYIDCSALKRIRVVADGASFTQAFDIQVLANTLDSVS